MTAPVGTAPNFNRLAAPYRWMEYLSFGPALERCRFHFLSRLAHCRSGLVLGDGDGRFTARLLAAYPDLRIHAIDGSPAMLAALRRRVAALDATHRLATETTDLRLWSAPSTPPDPFLPFTPDCIATHFFLDCLTTPEVARLARSLSALAAPGCLWVVSEFAIPARGWMRPLAAALVAALYRAFGWLTGLQPQQLPDHPTALAASGWHCIQRHRHLGGLLVSELWQLR